MGSSIEKITIWVRKLCLWVQNPQCLPDSVRPPLKKRPFTLPFLEVS